MSVEKLLSRLLEKDLAEIRAALDRLQERHNDLEVDVQHLRTGDLCAGGIRGCKGGPTCTSSHK